MRQSQHPYCAKSSGPHGSLHQTCLSLPRQPSPADSHPPQHHLITPTASHTPLTQRAHPDPERAPITPSHTSPHSIPASRKHNTPQRNVAATQRNTLRDANTAYGRGGRDGMPESGVFKPAQPASSSESLGGCVGEGEGSCSVVPCDHTRMQSGCCECQNGHAVVTCRWWYLPTHTRSHRRAAVFRRERCKMIEGGCVLRVRGGVSECS